MLGHYSRCFLCIGLDASIGPTIGYTTYITAFTWFDPKPIVQSTCIYMMLLYPVDLAVWKR